MTHSRLPSLKKRNLILTLVGACGLVALFLVPGEASPGAVLKPNRYIGAAKCKSCHKSEASGNQYEVWSGMQHAKAFETLGSDEAKELAAALGIEDPQKAEACLKCHVTAFGVDEELLARGFKPELGVQCESCHGPGEKHMKARFAAAAAAEEDDEAPGYTGAAAEEMNTQPGVEICTGCHRPESPSYEPFCYYEARVKIRHLNPLKPRTEEELAEMAVCPSGDPCAHAEGCPDGVCNLEPEELKK